MNFLRYRLINRQLNQERIFRDHTNPLDSMNDAELYDHYRFDHASIFFIRPADVRILCINFGFDYFPNVDFFLGRIRISMC
uniref:Uncharacterized protein n=1 Tax=Romanomermis culicivorax TaxID=13658 RepID=A0A915IEJ1_ROMCU